MSEEQNHNQNQSIEPGNDVADRKARDRDRLKNLALRHSAIVLATLALWGTADAWALSHRAGFRQRALLF
jgi:hypothetical protein